MDEHRDAVTDAALERELHQALEVEPSPEFTARVRMRIASEQLSPRRWWPSWRYAVATLAVVSTATAVIITIQRQPRAVDARGDTVRAAALPVPAPEARTGIVTQPLHRDTVARRRAFAPRTAAPRTAAPRTAAPSHHDDPQVIVSPQEQRAFWTFVAAERANLVPPIPQPQKPEATEDGAITLSAIEINPVDTESLPEVAQLEVEQK